jgi:hypothetical protein
MGDSADEDVWLTAAECANRIGLTTRALRLYEQHGLINPRRTKKLAAIWCARDGPAERNPGS